MYILYHITLESYLLLLFAYPYVEVLRSLSIQDTVLPVERDCRLTLGGRMIQIRAECIVLEDKYLIAGVLKSVFFL
jgi:hypothetical protein